MRRLLVTGATGLIGRQLLPQLATANYDVHALVNRRAVPADLQRLANWHAIDLCDAAATRELIHAVKPDGLIHLAWPLPDGNTNSELNRPFLHASQALLREFYDQGGARSVVAGTCFEYDWSQGLCSERDTPLRPTTLYGTCKNLLREYLEEYGTTNNHSWAWGRIFFVYGPHQERARFVPSVIHGLLEQIPVPCTEGRQVRDYLHTYDVASGLLRLFESELRGASNVASGEAVTLREIGEELARIMGGRHLLQFGARPTPAGEPPVIIADVANLRAQLGWRPRYTLAEGLAATVAAFRGVAPQALAR